MGDTSINVDLTGGSGLWAITKMLPTERRWTDNALAFATGVWLAVFLFLCISAP